MSACLSKRVLKVSVCLVASFVFVFLRVHFFRLQDVCLCQVCSSVCACVFRAAVGFNQEEVEIDGRPVIEAVAG